MVQEACAQDVYPVARGLRRRDGQQVAVGLLGDLTGVPANVGLLKGTPDLHTVGASNTNRDWLVYGRP